MGGENVHIAEAIPRIEKWRIVPVGKEVKPSSLVVDLQSSSQLSADELLERFRRYRGNGLFASSHCAPFRFLPVPLAYLPRRALSLSFSLPSPLSLSHFFPLGLADSLQAGESHAGIYTSPWRAKQRIIICMPSWVAEDFAVHKLS